MTKIIRYTPRYLCMLSDYGSPELHRHLAAHIVCAADGVLQCTVGTAHTECRGIMIRSDVPHEIRADGRMIVFLLASTSRMAERMEERCLSGAASAPIPEETAAQIREIFAAGQADPDEAILRTLGIFDTASIPADARVLAAIAQIEQAQTIGTDMMERLCETACLSQSRLSHLFRAETGNTLAGFLAFMKMRRAFEYAERGMNLTDAAMYAGFDSSSHLAATCKRMFGISLSAFLRSQKG